VITSKEVFAKRKEGAIDEAYRMALELMATPNANDWDRKAFCWCLIDIIKRDAGNGSNETLTHYRRQLESIDADRSDDVLAKGIRNALSLCNPGGRELSQAKALGKEGRHAEAAAAYRKALAACPADRETQTGFGWELYKHSKELMAAENVNLGAVKRNLNDYLNLDVEKPSLLHSRILQLAAKLAGENGFNMLVFARLWNLNNLRPEDYERYRADDGKEYPSLAEKVIQRVGKEAAATDSAREQEQALSHLNAAIERFPDNVWLKLDKAKILVALGRHQDALTFGVAVAKAKPNDYWAWELVGDIVSQTNAETALGCYCKALSCHTEDKFTGRVRLKVAQHMLEGKDYAAAKLEVETIVRAKESEGHKVPKEAAEMASQPWFAKTMAASSNRDYYNSKLPSAEALLYGNLPWVNACIGEKFTVVTKEGKKKHKRKIFLETSSIPVEVTIPESKLGGKKWSVGDPIKVKGEFDDSRRFLAFVIDDREGKSSWDVFPESIGVVDHVNHEKGVLHFIVDREIDGVIPLSELETTFSEGDSIALRLSRYTSKHGPACRVQSAKASDKEPSERVKKPFREEIRVSDGMGFTGSEIFIPPPLISRHQLNDGQMVSGKAVLNFNKKRSNWGWKAISISND